MRNKRRASSGPDESLIGNGLRAEEPSSQNGECIFWAGNCICVKF